MYAKSTYTLTQEKIMGIKPIGKMLTVHTRICLMCNKTGSVEVPLEEWRRYVAAQNDPSDPNRHIQTACPSLSAGEREQIISGTHQPCWDAMVADEEA